ncbi:minor capsid protein [Paenibacillus popilliae]|uniref:NAD+--asparagine ADP-ribosyltransferase n=1 Tax=Paenibacillus popilliae ATCC 14706 TaxID=1212764 RepID=M9L9V2_PAEPP|nr:minor capsid protein [Paenibacillus popilliae]GAC42287.1 NAD+--asparagine ADP-ribosyltransferase [Paenibacillus popilliae ATCC 14706]
MKPEEYWAKRMEDLNEAVLKKGEGYIKVQSTEYDKTLTRIKKETDAWYGRIAKNNNVGMAEARKLLSANELQEFKWSVEDYIKAGRENAIDQRWMKQLENASAKAHITRLEELQTKIQQEVELLTARRVKGTTDVLGDVYKSGYYKGIYEVQRGTGEGIPFARLDGKQLDKVLSKPWTPDGRNFSARIWQDRDKLLAELQTVLTQDLIRGENADKVIADFADRMGVSKRAAERLILTESAYFAGQSRLDGYKEQGIAHYKFVATLDKRTSAQCRDMDGERIPLSEAKPGVNYPPLHAYCRSTTIPVFDDGMKEPSEHGERAARGKNGKTYSVPGNMTYKDWADKHAPSAEGPPKITETPPVTPPQVKTVPDEKMADIEMPGSEPKDVPIQPKLEPNKPPAPKLEEKLVPEPPPLTKQEEAAVSRYIGSESYVLNDKLRHGQPLNSNEMEWVNKLDKALSKLPSYRGDVTRSLHFASITALNKFIKDYEPGGVVQCNEYLSTTVGSTYNPEGQVQIYILDAALGKDIVKYNETEQEILYQRNSNFEVIAVEVINGVYHILLREIGE